jgi:hypothetical protein
MSAASGYALGYSTEEERRLALQARMFERLTEDVLRHAGIREGMMPSISAAALAMSHFLPRAWLGRTGLWSALTEATSRSKAPGAERKA